MYMLEHDTVSNPLRKHGIRKRVPLTWITPEPNLGHFGIGGIRGGETLLKMFCKMRNIQYRTNAAIAEVTEQSVTLAGGESIRAKWNMLVPPLRDSTFVHNCIGLGDVNGFMPTKDGYQHVAHANISIDKQSSKIDNGGASCGTTTRH